MEQEKAKDLIWECIWDLQNTFSKDDIKNVSRRTLEDLIIRTTEKLQTIVEDDLAWWDLPSPDEMADFQLEVISVR